MKENIYIDLSKCSEEQRKHIFSLLPKCINEEDYMIFDSFYNLHSDKGRWYCGSSWVSIVKTELTYPEFIKLFEDGEEETSLQIALKALEDIVNPIGYMKSQLKDGESLNGHYAIMISDKPKFYQDIAKEALEKINSK